MHACAHTLGATPWITCSLYAHQIKYQHRIVVDQTRLFFLLAMSHHNSIDDDDGSSSFAFFLFLFLICVLRVHKPKNKKQNASRRRLSGEVTLRENALTLTCKRVPLSTCIIYIVFKSVEKIELNRNWFQSNNVISCLLCLLFFSTHWFSLDTLAYLLLLLLPMMPLLVINIESFRTFFLGLSQRITAPKNINDIWRENEPMRGQCMHVNETNTIEWRKNRDEKSRAYVGPSVGQLIIDSYYYYTWCYSYSSLKWIACWIQNKKRNET